MSTGMQQAVAMEISEEPSEEVISYRRHLAPKKSKKQRSFSIDSNDKSSSSEEEEEVKTSLVVSQQTSVGGKTGFMTPTKRLLIAEKSRLGVSKP